MSASKENPAVGEPAIRRILTCVTLSPYAPAVVRAARGLAACFGAEVTLLHVGEDRLEVQKRLRQEHAMDDEESPAPALLIRPGRADAVICRAAAEIDADLIVAGALERESAVRSLLGSTARNVARRAPCSVFLLLAGGEPFVPWGRVVARIDLDAAARELLDLSLALAGHGAELHLVHEYSLPGLEHEMHRPAAAQESMAYADHGYAEARMLLGNVLEPLDLTRFSVTTQCVRGRNSVEVIRYADAVSADLLVLPAPRRRMGWLDRFFGNPMESVLDTLPCSVLLFRGRRA